MPWSLLHFQEPIKLSGEGEYNLNVLKEIKATSYYLGLDKKIRDCQFEESLHNCTTRNYLDTFLEKCGCLPFNVRLQDKVLYCNLFNCSNIFFNLIIFYFIGTNLLFIRAKMCGEDKVGHLQLSETMLWSHCHQFL